MKKPFSSIHIFQVKIWQKIASKKLIGRCVQKGNLGPLLNLLHLS
jgi:hypothetical protein